MDKQVVYIVARRRNKDMPEIVVDSVWTDRLQAHKRFELAQRMYMPLELVSLQMFFADVPELLKVPEVAGE